MAPSMSSPPSIFPTYLLPSIPFRRRSKPAPTPSPQTSSTLAAPLTPPATPPKDMPWPYEATASSSQHYPTSYDSAPASPPNSPPNPSYLHGSTSHLRCLRCQTDLGLTSQVISKGFTGRHGRAYLVSPYQTAIPSNPLRFSPLGTPPLKRNEIPNLPNTHTHKPVPRQLVTGAHTVSDIGCAVCGSVLGWKYVGAEEESQKYKVGKFILETRRISKTAGWENDEDLGEAEIPRSSCEKLLPQGARLGKTSEDVDDEIEFDSQDEDECEDLFAGIWSPELARKRRKRKALFEKRREEASEDV